MKEELKKATKEEIPKELDMDKLFQSKLKQQQLRRVALLRQKKLSKARAVNHGV